MPKEARMSDRWLSVGEIAEHLGVSRDTVYTWVNERGMPAHKIGKLWKFDKNEVDAWVRSGERRKKKLTVTDVNHGTERK